MSALQRISAGCVFLHGEQRRLPALHVVARSAFATIGMLGKLSIVRIGLVAIHALGKRQRFLEIAVDVALCAIYGCMFSQQRELGLRMVKVLAHCLERNLLPSAGVMTGLATLREAAMMRILVAIRALVERNTRILRFAIRSISVALGAFHLSVKPGQGIAGLRVIEFADSHRLPVLKIVARLTGRSEAAFVFVLVTRQAGAREAEERPIRILDLDRRALLRRNVRRTVALVASKTGVLAFQQISSLFVIEGFGIPLDEREIFAIVLGVTAGAFLARTRRNVVGSVQASARRKPASDFGMAIQALQRGLSAKLVATRTICGTVQRLVRPGKRPR